MRTSLLILFALIATVLLVSLVFFNLPIASEPTVVSDAAGQCLNCAEDINVWGIYQKYTMIDKLVYFTLTIMLLYLGWSFCARSFGIWRLPARVRQYYQNGHYTLLRVWKLYQKSADDSK